MAQTKQQRVYPSTIAKIEAAELPVFLDTTASKVDYLVGLGLTVLKVEALPSPHDAVNTPLLVYVKE